MLTPAQKKAIGQVLEDYSELTTIHLDSSDATADILLSVLPDDETNKCRELDDLTWKDARNTRYQFKLSGVGRIAISNNKETLPPEISKIANPSTEFVAFACSLFHRQNIYEWNCFENPDRRFKGEWSANWVYNTKNHAAEQPLESIMFFKERGSAVWVICLWFSALKIEEFGDLTVDEFIARYPKRTS